MTAIPRELIELCQWVVWRWEDRGGKATKPLYNAISGSLASTTDRSTWTTFEKASTAREKDGWDGIGFVFTRDDPFSGVDLDKCRNSTTGKIDPKAREIADALNSYTEVSPSGTGLHVICRGPLPPGGRKRGTLEMYDGGRYFCVTGEHLEGTPLTTEERGEELAALHTRYFGKAKAKVAQPVGAVKPSNLGDAELLEKAGTAKGGAKFTALMGGDWSGYASQSEADSALCCRLAFWTGKDAARIDRLFRKSGLYRQKWDEPHYGDGRTYGQGTIERALELTTETYKPGPPSSIEPAPSGNNQGTLYVPAPAPALPPECLRGTFSKWVSMWQEYEGTDAFDFIAIMVAYGITLGRRVYIDYANPTFGNFYACFYGPTTTSKKSSAAARGVDLALAASPTLSRIGGLLSAEGLLQQMGHDPTDDKAPPRPRRKALMELEEFRILLSKARQEGATGLIPFLTGLWDCRPEYSLTVRRCPIVAEEPMLSILAGSTEEWLEAGLVEADTYGGFTNRWLFITGPMRPLNPLPPSRDQQQWNAIVKQLHDASDAFKMDTKVVLSEPAAASWRAFYLDFHGQNWGTETVAKVVQRVPVYVMKIAMLYAVDRGESTITAEDMEAAISFGQFATHSAASLFAGISGSKTAKLERLIRKHLEAVGTTGLSRRTLHQGVGGRYTSHEFNQAVDAMLKTGEVSARSDNLILSGVSTNAP